MAHVWCVLSNFLLRTSAKTTGGRDLFGACYPAWKSTDLLCFDWLASFLLTASSHTGTTRLHDPQCCANCGRMFSLFSSSPSTFRLPWAALTSCEMRFFLFIGILAFYHVGIRASEIGVNEQDGTSLFRCSFTSLLFRVLFSRVFFCRDTGNIVWAFNNHSGDEGECVIYFARQVRSWHSL